MTSAGFVMSIVNTQPNWLGVKSQNYEPIQGFTRRAFLPTMVCLFFRRVGIHAHRLVAVRTMASDWSTNWWA